MSTSKDQDLEGSGEELKDIKSVVCVEYPGLVKNSDAMLETLGGTDNLSKVFSDPSRRLELRFRPKDPFCKPTCGDRSQASSLLLRVRRVQKRGCKCNKSEIRTEIVAPVEATFTFNNLCDFQYLPTETTKTLKPGQIETKSAKPKEYVHKPIMNQVHFDKLVDSKWLNEPSPLFIPPAAFSRMDQPQDYHYRKDTSGTAIKSAMGTPLNIIGRTRQRRTLHAVFVNYEVDKVPDKPNEVAVNQLKVKFIESDERQRVWQAFQEQPIWTKSGLNCTLEVSMERLKFILPTVAYYFTSGPWRNQWTRFGYDPRKDPAAAKFQTLDFRVRLEGGAKLKVRAKRSYANYLLPYKSMNWSKPKTSTIVRETFDDMDEQDEASNKTSDADNSAKSRYIFEEGVIPPHRQMFYQYKDIRVSEVQKIFKTSLDPIAKECDEKNGWYLPGADAKARQILTTSITKTLTANAKKEDKEDESVIDEEEEDDNNEEDVGEIVDEIMEEMDEDPDFEV